MQKCREALLRKASRTNCGGGEGTCISNVSIGTDYILNSFPSPPAYYESYNVWDIYPKTSILVHLYGTYESIQGCWVSPHTSRYCRRRHAMRFHR